MSQTVIVTTREELSTIVSQAVRREMASVVKDMDTVSERQSLTPVEAAHYLGQAPNTLRQWRSQGRGPAYEKRGRNVRYKRHDLDAWRNAKRVITGEALEASHHQNQFFPALEGFRA